MLKRLLTSLGFHVHTWSKWKVVSVPWMMRGKGGTLHNVTIERQSRVCEQCGFRDERNI